MQNKYIGNTKKRPAFTAIYNISVCKHQSDIKTIFFCDCFKMNVADCNLLHRRWSDDRFEGDRWLRSKDSLAI